MKTQKPPTLICAACGNTIPPKRTHKNWTPKFCSSKCHGASMRKPPKACEHCGVEFSNYRNPKFCSKKCACDHRKQNGVAPEHRARMAGCQKGKVISAESRARMSAAKTGKPITHFIENRAAIILKIRASLTGKPQPKSRGEGHHNYKDGRTLRNDADRHTGRVEYKNFRRAVLDRDGHACRSCGRSGGTLHVHHIAPYAERADLRHDPDNGKTLCPKCHKAQHPRRAVSAVGGAHG